MLQAAAAAPGLADRSDNYMICCMYIIIVISYNIYVCRYHHIIHYYRLLRIIVHSIILCYLTLDGGRLDGAVPTYAGNYRGFGYDRSSKAQSGQVGRAPGGFELSKGTLK